MEERLVIRIYRWGEEEPVFAFFPEENGDDDGGRDYVLPVGYTVDSEDGSPFICGEKPCALQNHNGLPVLVDETKKRAFLLERDRKIERMRERAGLSRAELAEALGASQMEVYRWERYEVEPGTALLGRIAHALGCDTEDLI